MAGGHQALNSKCTWRSRSGNEGKRTREGLRRSFRIAPGSRTRKLSHFDVKRASRGSARIAIPNHSEWAVDYQETIAQELNFAVLAWPLMGRRPRRSAAPWSRSAPLTAVSSPSSYSPEH